MRTKYKNNGKKKNTKIQFTKITLKKIRRYKNDAKKKIKIQK